MKNACKHLALCTLTLILCLALAACGSDNSGDSADYGNDSTVPSTIDGFVKESYDSYDYRLSIIIKRTETQVSRLCVFSLLQPHRTEVRLTGKYRYLTFEDRKKIEAWHLLGDRPVDIAARLSVHHTTIYKELQRGATGTLDANQREGYSAELAERRLRESFKRRGKRAPAAQ